MSQAETLTLIAQLQRAKRRWKILALSLLGVLVVLFLSAALLMISGLSRAKAEQMRALEAMEFAERLREDARRAEQRTTGDDGHKDRESRPTEFASLPDISVFQIHPSDRFLVDLDEFTSGHPFKGVDSAQPHAGAHINFDNSANRWPKGGKEPASYPAIYAVADGIVSRVDSRFGLPGGNDRYGVDLTFAVDPKGNKCRLRYSIEPMIPEPSEGFYRRFIMVNEGQKVRKGDVLAYMYCPPGGGSHIHFHLMVDGKRNFLAPALFTSEVVRQFHAKWGGFGRDGDTPIPPCLGYLISAEENPFGTGAKERL